MASFSTGSLSSRAITCTARAVSVSILTASDQTGKAASRLSEQFRSGTIAKIYWAIVEGLLKDDAGAWSDVLAKDSRINRTRVTSSPFIQSMVAG